MASSPRPYENDFRKNAGNVNQFLAPKVMIKEKEMSEARKNNIIDWVTYYRRNIHRFVQHYFGIKLHLYQVIWLYFMGISETFVTIASRASAKSWLIAVYALAISVLKPNSEVVIVAATKKQGGIIFGKINSLKNDYSNIAREIRNFKINQSDWYCELHNNSTIKVVSCSEGGRGERSTLTLGEEFRIMDKQKYDSIVKPFAYARQAPYLKNPKYEHLIEEPKEILISSAYHKGLWWYQETIMNIKMMLQGKNVGFIAFDYLIAIKHGIKTKKQIAKEKITMDEITFMEEYENIPFGENSNAYFKLDMFKKNRKIKKSFYPLKQDMLDKKKNPNDIKPVDGEIRLVSCDIATRTGRANDNTIITCMRLLPTSKGYKREVVYMESHHGENTILQTLRIKQIYYDFNADYIVLDIQQAGISIYEQLGVVTKDEERGIEYVAFTVYEHKSLDKPLIDELKSKTLAINAKPIIYPISGSAKLNNDIAVDFRDKLQRSMVEFLVDENVAEDYLMINNKEFQNTEDVYTKVWYIHPYKQISEMIIETVNLEYSVSGSNIKLDTIGKARKDRYTSVSYCSWVASILEKDYLKETESDNSISNFIHHVSKINNIRGNSTLKNIFR